MTNEEFIKNISFEGEEWRDVVGFEGLYMVSSFGRVISLKREVRNTHCSCRVVEQHILTPNKNTSRPKYIRHSYHLYKNKRNRKSITAHRIVATAFIPNPNNYPDIDHIDGNPLNNNVHNLRWCNQVMNMNNPITRKRLSNSKTGKLNTKKSIPVVRISNDGMIETFPSVMEAYRNGYNHSSILKCCKHKMHTHKGCKWMFLSDYENLTSKSKNDICQTSD